MQNYVKLFNSLTPNEWRSPEESGREKNHAWDNSLEKEKMDMEYNK